MTGLGVLIRDTGLLPDAVRLVRVAEDLGVDEVWQTEVGPQRDALIAVTAYLAATQRLLVGVGITNVWTRLPSVLAGAAATMAELAPGRVALGIGPWWEPAAARHGARRHRPVAAMADAACIIRALLAGETVEHRGEVFTAHDLQRAAVDVPLVFGVTGPRLTRLAGELADGLLLNYGTPVTALAQRLALVHEGALTAGRNPRSISVRALVWCASGDRMPVRRLLLDRPDLLHAGGMAEADAHALSQRAAIATGEQRDRLAAEVPDAAVDLVAATGSGAEIRAGIERFRAAGADTVVLAPLTDPIVCLQAATGDSTTRPTPPTGRRPATRVEPGR